MTAMQKVEAPLIENEDTKKHGLGSMKEARWAELNKQLKDLGLTKKVIPAKEMFYTFKN